MFYISLIFFYHTVVLFPIIHIYNTVTFLYATVFNKKTKNLYRLIEHKLR